MYFMVDPTGTVVSVNGFAASQLGYTAAELIGQSVLNVLFEEDRELEHDPKSLNQKGVFTDVVL